MPSRISIWFWAEGQSISLTLPKKQKNAFFLLLFCFSRIVIFKTCLGNNCPFSTVFLIVGSLGVKCSLTPCKSSREQKEISLNRFYEGPLIHLSNEWKMKFIKFLAVVRHSQCSDCERLNLQMKGMCFFVMATAHVRNVF